MTMAPAEVAPAGGAHRRRAMVRIALMLGGAALASYGLQRRDRLRLGLLLAGGALIGIGLVRPVTDQLLTGDPGGPRWSI